MATSTFGKQFLVSPEKANVFVKEITKTVAPTLRNNFHSNLIHKNDISQYIQMLLK